tara:strand:+ start:1124 stop:1942 length:819 start_codon:yes stop_codon:yes gene_type:complete
MGQELFIQHTDQLKGSVQVMGKSYTTVYDNTTHRYRYFDELGKEIFLIKSFNEKNKEVNLSIEKNPITESIEVIMDNSVIGLVVNSVIYNLDMVEIGRLFGGRYSDKNINDFWEGVDYSRGNISIYDHAGFYKIGSLMFKIEVDYYAVLGLEKIENIDSLDSRSKKKSLRNIQRTYKKLMKQYDLRRNPDDAEIKERSIEITKAYNVIMSDLGIDSKKDKKILGIIPPKYLSEERRSNWSDNEGYVPYSQRVVEEYNPDSQIQKDELYSNEE